MHVVSVHDKKKYFQFPIRSAMPRQLPVVQGLYATDVKLKLLVLRTTWNSARETECLYCVQNIVRWASLAEPAALTATDTYRQHSLHLP